VPVLASVRDELRGARAADVASGGPLVAVRACALDAGRGLRALARARDGAVARRAGLDLARCPRVSRPRPGAAAADDTGADDRRDAHRPDGGRLGRPPRARLVV